MLASAVILIVASYFLGGVPTAYIAGRLIRGIDLRQYGSGTVSGSMAFEHVGRWTVVPVGLFDIGKGALPTWLALRLGLGNTVAAAAGLAAAAGHDWPPYLGFTGGRGISTFMGMMLVLFPWGTLWVLGALAIGFALGDSAPWVLPCLVTMPLLAQRVHGPAYVPALALGMVVLTVLKRVEANRRALPPPGAERRWVLLRRVLLDRDVPSKEAWIHRVPDARTTSSATEEPS